MTEIPKENDWADYKSSLDSLAAHERFYGKSNAEMQREFYNGVTRMFSEILFMPSKAFQYYILGLAQFVASEKFHEIYSMPSTSAGCLFDIISQRLDKDPESVLSAFDEVNKALEFVATHAEKFQSPSGSDDFGLAYQEIVEKVANIKKK